jgi:hypothetical protein
MSGDDEEKPWSPTGNESQLLALPDRESPAATAGDPASNVTTVVVDGGVVKLDQLGPMIVNSDGTISRISNWHRLSEDEQKVALRRIGKRNRERLAVLQAQAATEHDSSGVKLHGAGNLVVGVPSPHSLKVAAEAAGDKSTGAGAGSGAS